MRSPIKIESKKSGVRKSYATNKRKWYINIYTFRKNITSLQFFLREHFLNFLYL